MSDRSGHEPSLGLTAWSAAGILPGHPRPAHQGAIEGISVNGDRIVLARTAKELDCRRNPGSRNLT